MCKRLQLTRQRPLDMTGDKLFNAAEKTGVCILSALAYSFGELYTLTPGTGLRT